jgi:hypothetical protein
MAVPGTGVYGDVNTHYRTVDDSFADIVSLGGDAGGPLTFVVKTKVG